MKYLLYRIMFTILIILSLSLGVFYNDMDYTMIGILSFCLYLLIENVTSIDKNKEVKR